MAEGDSTSRLILKDGVTVKCQLCLVICDITDGILISECNHIFCRPCSRSNFANSNDGIFECPFNDGENICGQIILPTTLRLHFQGDYYLMTPNRSTKIENDILNDTDNEDSDEKGNEKEDDSDNNEDHFKCMACFDIYELTDGMVLTECHHIFCRSCTTALFENGDDGVFECPFEGVENICGQIILPNTVKECFSNEDYFELLMPIQNEDGILDDEKEDDFSSPGENETEFECIVCFDKCQPKMGYILSECFHKFCKECISSVVETTNNVQIQCPYEDDVLRCDKTINHSEVRLIVSIDIWDKFQEKYINISLLRDKEATQCRNGDCNQWFYIDDDYYVNNSFVCTACSKVNCVLCKGLHNPATLTCEDFVKTQNNPTEHGVEYLLQMLADHKAMRCPTCQEVIMKDVGCDFLTCIKCVTDLCWATQGPRWGPNGAGDTSGGCRCGVNGVRCTPTCQNCH